MNLKPCPRCKQNYFDSASGICLRCDKVNEDDLFDQLQEANKRIAELEALTQWQPIETAPKDGNWIICTSTSSIFVWFSLDDGYYGNTEPTHWKPLPEPPKEQGS